MSEIKILQEMILNQSMDFSIFKTKINVILFCLKRPITSIYIWPTTSLSINQKMTMKQSEIIWTTQGLSQPWKRSSTERAKLNVFLVPKPGPLQIYLVPQSRTQEFTALCQDETLIQMLENQINLRVLMQMEPMFMTSVVLMETRKIPTLLSSALQCTISEKSLTSCTEGQLKITGNLIRVTFYKLRLNAKKKTFWPDMIVFWRGRKSTQSLKFMSKSIIKRPLKK